MVPVYEPTNKPLWAKQGNFRTSAGAESTGNEPSFSEFFDLPPTHSAHVSDQPKKPEDPQP